MFEKEKLLILRYIIQEQFRQDSQLSEALSIDIHKVRLILNQLQESGYIKIIEHEQSQNPNLPKVDLVVATKVNPKAYLVLNGGIPLDNDNYISPNITINHGNIGIGHMSGGEISESAKIAGVINEAKDDKLHQLLEEIQNLLEKLEKTNPSDTRREKFEIADKAIEQIKNDHSLSQRTISALENGFIGYLKARLISPVTSFFIAALEDWQQTRK